ncbi:WXG100 family type VII secretion target [Oliverpabstia intestinalis]|uniref:WXG100 family type VII secretion target n=1 Tax=Oliverpabstia intestinalis TaxID=2606633 RepID=UPI003F995528
MKTARSISIAFGNAIAQAEKLEASAEQMRASKRQLDSIRDSLKTEWEGESASLYFQKCDLLGAKLDKTAGELAQIAAVIRKSARAYRDAEMKALEAVQTKTLT